MTMSRRHGTGCEQLLADTGEHEVAGEAANGHEALEIAARENPRRRSARHSHARHGWHRNGAPPEQDGGTPGRGFSPQPTTSMRSTLSRPMLLATYSNLSGGNVSSRPSTRRPRLTTDEISEIGKEPGISGQRKHICARLHDELKLIPVTKVNYFVADQKYVSVVHKDGRDLIEDSLKSLEQEFEDKFSADSPGRGRGRWCNRYAQKG